MPANKPKFRKCDIVEFNVDVPCGDLRGHTYYMAAKGSLATIARGPDKFGNYAVYLPNRQFAVLNEKWLTSKMIDKA